MSAHWPLNETFRLRLTMLTDWHVGSGTGRPGNIDRLIVRDADGLPFVPAKTLRGIWRDGCERLARALDDGKTGDWSRLVDRVFGSQPALGGKDPTGRHNDPVNTPIESALAVRPARLPDALRQRVRDKKDNRPFLQAMTFVKPGVKIDHRSGRAQTDFLRFEEMARAGTVLEAECALTLPSPELREALGALLVGGAKLIERLGGKRRRGPGRCRLEVLNVDVSAAVAYLEQNEKPSVWPTVSISETPVAGGRPSSDPWLVVPLVLHLAGPLAVSYRTVGNVVETLDFVPGSYMLPHVTRALTKLGVDPRAAIQRGDLCVLPATLEVGGERGQPVPMALFADKEDQTKITNRLLTAEPAEGQYKQMRTGYVVPAKAPRKVPLVVRTHNTVEDGPQRPTSDVGGVYTYEAIAPVQLRSELRLRRGLIEDLAKKNPQWWKSLGGPVSLGRSKKDDYGEVTIKVEGPRDFAKPAASGQELLTWLVSDVLLRDQALRPAPTAQALAVELSKRLGVGVDVRNPDQRLSELVRVRRLDTWHVGWGLPRPSFVALQAGSCIAFELKGSVDPARLHDIEASGIGERTAEGYGQIRFNDPLLTTTPAQWPREVETNTNQNAAAQQAIVDVGHLEYARLLEREVWKQHIRHAALALAASGQQRQEAFGWRINRDQSQPPISQLGGLRGQISQLRGAEQDVGTILAWLDHLAANRRRAEKWPDGAIDRIQQLLRDRRRVWTVLECRGWSTLTDGADERLRGELWALAVRTLLDASIRAHKRDLEGNHGA